MKILFVLAIISYIWKPIFLLVQSFLVRGRAALRAASKMPLWLILVTSFVEHGVILFALFYCLLRF